MPTGRVYIQIPEQVHNVQPNIAANHLQQINHVEIV